MEGRGRSRIFHAHHHRITDPHVVGASYQYPAEMVVITVGTTRAGAPWSWAWETMATARHRRFTSDTPSGAWQRRVPVHGLRARTPRPHW